MRVRVRVRVGARARARARAGATEVRIASCVPPHTNRPGRGRSVAGGTW